jgi:hypothetical protein
MLSPVYLQLLQTPLEDSPVIDSPSMTNLYFPPQPVTGIALLFLLVYFCSKWLHSAYSL